MKMGFSLCGLTLLLIFISSCAHERTNISFVLATSADVPSPILVHTNMFVEALFITLVIEFLIALVYINIGRKAIPKNLKINLRVLSTIFLANMISLPIFWFIFPSTWNLLLMIILGEIFVVLFEGFLIHFLNKTIIPMKSALLLSFIINMGSLFLGYPLLFILL